MGVKKLLLVLLIIISSCGILYAAAPEIISVTMVPPTPLFGQQVDVTIELCVPKYNTHAIAVAFSDSPTYNLVGSGGQVFVVSSKGVNVPSVTYLTSEDDLGYAEPLLASDSGAINNCNGCGEANARTVTLNYTLNVPPAKDFPTCDATTMYLHVGTKDSYFSRANWETRIACNSESLSWTMPTFTPYFSIAKRYEGVLESPGDKILFSIDYEYANGNNFQIQDAVPGGFTLLSWGPQANGSNSSGNITWTFPNRSGQSGLVTGTVWMLLEADGPTLQPSYTNTANGSMDGVSNQSSIVTVTAGEPAVSIIKAQSVPVANSGDIVTYYLTYEVSGYILKNYEPFDDMSLGTYTGANVGPPGWEEVEGGGDSGTWQILDQCGTGDRVLRGSSTGYPSLLLDDGSAGDDSDQFCTGGIVIDTFTDPGTFPGADSKINIRSNGLIGNDVRSIGVVVSIDNAPAPGFFMIQKSIGNGQSYPAGGIPAMGYPSANKWYRVRINVTDDAGGQRIQAKIWPKGQPEPSAWDINYVDTDMYGADFLCDGTGTYNDWRPGINNQGGSTADVENYYDNFGTYDERTTSANTTVEDGVPTDIIYGGCLGCSPSGSGGSEGNGYARWSLGSLSNESGTLTWWGEPDCSGGDTTIPNQAFIDTTGGQPVYSNITSLDVVCATDTFTPTNTPTDTPTDTPTPTATYTFTDTPSPTPTYTFTNTPTDTFTNTPSDTYTDTPTETPSPTQTFTDTPTQTFTDTATDTPTNTFTDTFTETPSPTATDTPTETFTETPTNTFTDTFTDTPSPTPTDTPTETFTETFTNTFTDTYTETPTSTFTNTPSDTATGVPPPTWTFSSTPTDTPTETFTHTFTDTPTDTPTNTFTNTFTETFTDTPTSTFTNTFTETYSNTPTNTFTDTFTPTDTPTGIPPPTWTFSATPSNTPTETFTYTFTDTPTNTPTETDTVPGPTNTFTHTPTNTNTNTNTSTMTDTYTNTPTNTYTNTFTNTATDTPSNTSTNTFTATFTDTPTNTSTNTYTFTFTETPTFTNTFTTTHTFTNTYTPTPEPAQISVGLQTTGYNPGYDKEVVYKVTIRNNGTSDAYGFAIWDTLPGIMTYTSNDIGADYYVDANNMVVMTLPPDRVLHPGDMLVIEFKVNLEHRQAPYIPNDVSIDYNDQRYQPGVDRSPPIRSNTVQYPGVDPVVYPNPYNSEFSVDGMIKFDNIVPGSRVEVYTISGESVVVLPCPEVKVLWDRNNVMRQVVSPGIYYYIVRNMYSNEYYRGKFFVQH